MSTLPPAAPVRLNYLDQFRGYTVFGMIVVNFLGGFHQQIWPVLHHHNTYCSYADTIMPQFFFAVGFALRYTMVKRMERDGWAAAHLRIVRRVLALLLVAAVVHGFDKVHANWETLLDRGLLSWLKAVGTRNFFQTLTHIAVATLWVMPVIGQRWPIRLGWLVFSVGLHLWCSYAFYLKFALDRPVIDGGPLGFLTWSIPLLAGTFISDFLSQPNRRVILPGLVVSSLLVMGLGYGMSGLKIWPVDAGTNEPVASLVEKPLWEPVPPPFLPPMHPTKPNATYAERHTINKYDVITLWTMSQQTGSASYQVFGAGFSIFVLAVCYVVFGQTGQIGIFRRLVINALVGIFRTLGSNALVAYIVHGMTIDAISSIMPKDGPLWMVLLGLSVVIAITWVVCYALEKKGWYVRV